MSNKQAYTLNVRLLVEEAPSVEKAREIHATISKALFAEGYNFLIWEQEVELAEKAEV